MNQQAERISRKKDIGALAGFILLVFLVSAIGGAITASSVGSWYQTLGKPPFNPPDWVFGPVWTFLYLLMALAAWRIWRRGPVPGRITALALFAVQLAANLTWSLVFFGLRAPGWALAEIIVLLALIFLTMRAFWRLDGAAGALLAPYFLWTGYALILNTSIVILN